LEEVGPDARASLVRAATFAALVVGAFLIALGPISDGDIYWHLAAGREMAARHALLRTDPFTLSAAGRPWIDVHWLFQLGAWTAYRLVGLRGLAVGKAVLVAGTAFILLRTAERMGGRTARALGAAALLVTLYLARHLLPLRPVIVTALCLAIFLSVLESARAGATRRLWLLPGLQVLWVNTQGLAPLGLALVASYALEAALGRRAHRAGPRSDAQLPLRPFLLTLLSCGLASFVTPFGLRAVALPAQLLMRIAPGQGNLFSSAIAENIPPFVLERTAPGQIGHFKWVLLGLAMVLALFRPRVRLAHALILGLFLSLALMANRNVLLLYLLAPPLVAGSIGAMPLAARTGQWIARACVPGLGAVLALAVLTFAQEPAFGAPTPFHFPTETARRLGTASGPVFAPDHAGGFLTFHAPGLRPYIDTRLVLHSAGEYAAFLALLDDPAKFDALEAVERFRYVVLTTSYPDRYLGLAGHLAQDPRWRLLYTDGAELLFAREGAGLNLGERGTVDAISTALQAHFPLPSQLGRAARLNLARLLAVAGQPGEALHVLAALDGRSAAVLRARAHFVAGELGGAEALAQLSLAQDASDLGSLTLLAEIAMNRGQQTDARAWLQRALAIDPYDPEARATLARLETAARPAPRR
jgi:hypothetical protein